MLRGLCAFSYKNKVVLFPKSCYCAVHTLFHEKQINRACFSVTSSSSGNVTLLLKTPFSSFCKHSLSLSQSKLPHHVRHWVAGYWDLCCQSTSSWERRSSLWEASGKPACPGHSTGVNQWLPTFNVLEPPGGLVKILITGPHSQNS